MSSTAALELIIALGNQDRAIVDGILKGIRAAINNSLELAANSEPPMDRPTDEYARK